MRDANSLWSLRNPRQVIWRLGRQYFDYVSPLPPQPSGLVVGECPGPHMDHRTPLVPWPVTCAGGCLMKYSGLTPAEYLGRLERVNQCLRVWSDTEARERRMLIVQWATHVCESRPRLLLLGRQVQRIWDVKSDSGFGRCERDGLEVAYAMHTSGLSRVYSETWAQEMVGSMVRWCAGVARIADETTRKSQ